MAAFVRPITRLGAGPALAVGAGQRVVAGTGVAQAQSAAVEATQAIIHAGVGTVQAVAAVVAGQGTADAVIISSIPSFSVAIGQSVDMGQYITGTPATTSMTGLNPSFATYNPATKQLTGTGIGVLNGVQLHANSVSSNPFNVTVTAASEFLFPRVGQIANGGWDSGEFNQWVSAAEAAARLDVLSRFDYVMIGMPPSPRYHGYTTASYSAALHAAMKANNPDSVLVQYVGATESPEAHTETIDHCELQTGPNGRYDWIARTEAGLPTSGWPGALSINITDFVATDGNGDYASEFMAEEYSRLYFDGNTYNNGIYIADGGTYDGVFIDVFNIRPNITRLADNTQVSVDWNGDGSDDSRADPITHEWYTIGQRRFFDRWVQKYPNHVMTANIAEWPYYAYYGIVPPRLGGDGTGWGAANEADRILDGGHLEGLMSASYVPDVGSWSPHSNSGWKNAGTDLGVMDQYHRSMTFLKGKKYLLFHALSEITEQIAIDAGAQDNTDYKFFRYALTSCLMDDGVFCHNKDMNSTNVKWFDEYDVNLGQRWPTSEGDPQLSPYYPAVTYGQFGVYRRRFTWGLALCNPEGNGPQTVPIESGYKRFFGSQDPSVNNGNAVSSVTLQDGDGIILITT